MLKKLLIVMGIGTCLAVPMLAPAGGPTLAGCCRYQPAKNGLPAYCEDCGCSGSIGSQCELVGTTSCTCRPAPN
jgi:hypothetical protein